MKIISWNLNGLIPCMDNGSLIPLLQIQPDLICFQETRTKERPTVFPGYYHHWLSGDNPGYAGVLTLSRNKPLKVQNGVGVPDLDREGRLLTLEFDSFWSVNAYFPKSQGKLTRHAFRLEWDAALLSWLTRLGAEKPIVLCGDFNVTRSPIDIYPENTRMMWAEEGYMTEERDDLETLLDAGFTDAFRHLYPDKEGAYTWWSNRLNKRKQNRGWRLDYFCVSNTSAGKIKDVVHHTDLLGSDHCPIELQIAL